MYQLKKKYSSLNKVVLLELQLVSMLLGGNSSVVIDILVFYIVYIWEWSRKPTNF